MRSGLTLAFAASVALSHHALAQTTGAVSVVGGSTTDARGIRANSISLAPGVQFGAGGCTMLWFGANGTSFESGAWSAGLNAIFNARAPLARGVTASLNASGSLTGTSYDATFLQGDVTPALELGWRWFTVSGGMRGAAGSVSIADAQQGGLLGRLSPDASRTRTSVNPSFGASALITGDWIRSGARLWTRVEPVQTDDARVTDMSAGATIVIRKLTVAVTAGQRDSADGGSAAGYGHAAAAYAVTPSVAVQVAAGSYLSDVHTGSAEGRFVNAGLRFTVGGARPGALPRASGAPPVAAGVTRLSIRAANARTVAVYGDWNGWTGQAAQRAANGVWYVDVRLDPGAYRYAFRIDETEWRVPRGAAAVDDGFGGKSAYVSVPDRVR